MTTLNVLKYLFTGLVISTSIIISGCNTSSKQANNKTAANSDDNWQHQFEDKLPMLGHRNWILVVDKAFPEQNAPGMEYIYANERLLPVLKLVLGKVNASAHVKPIIYQDKELNFITEDQAKGIKQFINESKAVLGTQNIQVMLHDFVFKKLDAESKLFKVLVIKTNETIPYTSVFLQLDCAYWNYDKEKQLRAAIAK